MALVREVLFEISPNEGGCRLDTYLGRHLRSFSRQRIQELIRDQLWSATGERLKPATVAKAGLRFRISYEAESEPPLPTIPVVFEDEVLLVVNKPAGLAVHPAGRHRECTLTAALAKRDPPKADPAHRLDRETSGLLVCGRGVTSTSLLKQAFAAGNIRKEYFAICEGWPTQPAFTIDRPLELGSYAVRVRMAVGRGKPAHTGVELLGKFVTEAGDRLSWLKCAPKTGRQHQIRAHLSDCGLPIVGDKIYGHDETAFIRLTQGLLTGEDQRRLRLPRHALHASRLTLDHPSTRSRLNFELDLPDDLSTFLSSLRRLD